MKINEGSTDRYLRLALGLILFALALMTHGTLAWVFGVLGTLMVVTGLSGFCLFYQLLGMNTCRR